MSHVLWDFWTVLFKTAAVSLPTRCYEFRSFGFFAPVLLVSRLLLSHRLLRVAAAPRRPTFPASSLVSVQVASVLMVTSSSCGFAHKEAHPVP